MVHAHGKRSQPKFMNGTKFFTWVRSDCLERDLLLKSSMQHVLPFSFCVGLPVSTGRGLPMYFFLTCVLSLQGSGEFGKFQCDFMSASDYMNPLCQVTVLLAVDLYISRFVPIYSTFVLLKRTIFGPHRTLPALMMPATTRGANIIRYVCAPPCPVVQLRPRLLCIVRCGSSLGNLMRLY